MSANRQRGLPTISLSTASAPTPPPNLPAQEQERCQAIGRTNNVVSVDDPQEFKVHTSIYTSEFGQTPGAQLSIITPSGTNEFRESVFDYLRNDVFDANDWIGNRKRLAKSAVRQNGFGGVLGVP